jgi:GTP-binding protein
MSRRFEVALIGRPNVGKSTLFNRLVGRRLALVDDQPGVTRDRRSGDARLGDLIFTVVDTAGLADVTDDSLAGRMQRQSAKAIADADLSLLMIDARSGVTPSDEAFAAMLRKSGKPVIVVANKAEGRGGEAGALEGYALGWGDPVPISAEHGDGLGGLHDALAEILDGVGLMPTPAEAARTDESATAKPLKVAIVGRPNVGKSTLVNRLIGEERLLTGPEPGITRDAIAVDWEWSGRRFQLHDTAGLRRKARVQERLEKLSVADALRAIRFAELVIIVIDATQPLEKQDLQIADLIADEGRAAVFAINKWDLVKQKKDQLAKLKEDAERLLPQLRGISLVPISATKGSGLDELMEAILAADAMWRRRLPTADLNRWLSDALAEHSPPAVSGRRVKLRYITQPKARPPTFVVFCSRPEALPAAYQRYLINGLRQTFGLHGTPIRLILRKGDNPYAKRNRRS